MSNESSEKIRYLQSIMDSGKSLFDIVLGKLISRKLLTFGIATALLSKQVLESGDWTLIACIYIGVQGAIDFYKIKNGISS